MSFKWPLELPDNHHIDDIAVACFDWRMRTQFVLFFEYQFRKRDFFRLNFPGGAKLINENPEFVIPTFFNTPIMTCHSRKIIILDHEDCLAWGGSRRFCNPEKEKEFHFEQLISSRDLLLKWYPENTLRIKLFYAQIMLDGKERPLLDFIEVK